MWKNILIAFVIGFVIFSPDFSVDAERSYTIDKLFIEARIDEEGIMHVKELFTYTFQGDYQGTTRSLYAKTKNFKAYEVTESSKVFDGLLENALPLAIEKEGNHFKIYADAKNETKHFL